MKKSKVQKLTRFTLADSDIEQLGEMSEHSEASWQFTAAVTQKYLEAQDALRLEYKAYAPRELVYAEIAKAVMGGRASVRQYHGMIYGERDGLGEQVIQEYRQFGISHWRLFRPEAKRRIGPKQKGEGAEDYRQRLLTECESIAEYWAQKAADRGAVTVPVDEVKQEYKPKKEKDTSPVWYKELTICAECGSSAFQNLPADMPDSDKADVLNMAQLASELAKKHEDRAQQEIDAHK